MLPTAKEINLEALRGENERLRREVERLERWLAFIDGGDAPPCTDEEQLRRWVYEALTLGKEVPE